MQWRFCSVLVLLLLFRTPPIVADSILDELTLLDPDGDKVTLGLTFDAAGNSIYTFVDPSSNPQAATPNDVDLTTSLLALILSLDGNSANLSPLFAPGAIFASFTADFAPVTTVGAISDSKGQSGAVENSASVPEPATLSLLSGFVLLVGAVILSGIRRISAAHIPIPCEASRNEPL